MSRTIIRRKKGLRNQGFKLRLLIFIIVLMAAGSIIGAFAETKIDSQSRTGAALYVNEILYENSHMEDKGAVFAAALKNNGLLLLIMAIGGLTVFLAPVSLLTVVFKGGAIGFTSALVMEGRGMGGIARVCAAILPQNILLIPVFLIYGYAVITFAANVYFVKDKRNRMRRYTERLSRLLITTAAAFALLLVASGIEAYINPVLLGIIT